jgi:hypothetical protein
MAKFLRLYDNINLLLKSTKKNPDLYLSDLELLNKVCLRLTPLKPLILINEMNSKPEAFKCGNCESLISLSWSYCPFCSQKIKKIKI